VRCQDSLNMGKDPLRAGAGLDIWTGNFSRWHLHTSDLYCSRGKIEHTAEDWCCLCVDSECILLRTWRTVESQFDCRIVVSWPADAFACSESASTHMTRWEWCACSSNTAGVSVHRLQTAVCKWVTLKSSRYLSLVYQSFSIFFPIYINGNTYPSIGQSSESSISVYLIFYSCNSRRWLDGMCVFRVRCLITWCLILRAAAPERSISWTNIGTWNVTWL